MLWIRVHFHESQQEDSENLFMHMSKGDWNFTTWHRHMDYWVNLRSPGLSLYSFRVTSSPKPHRKPSLFHLAQGGLCFFWTTKAHAFYLNCVLSLLGGDEGTGAPAWQFNCVQSTSTHMHYRVWYPLENREGDECITLVHILPEVRP